MKFSVFVDGQEGTTGLRIHEYLAQRADIEVLRIEADHRKDAGERARLLNAADVAFLCLPDAAAKEAVALVTNFRFTDDRLFNYPWVYATQVGWWRLDNAEILRLREYLTRGGFLVVDDFWGPAPEQWEAFRRTMDRVLPNRPISDIAPSDAVMHVLYDIEEKDRSFIPGTRHLRMGPGGTTVVRQPAGTTPAWRAIYDDHNRMLVAINYNTDIGDAWEYADSPQYPERMTALAYRYGINYLVYAMTH